MRRSILFLGLAALLSAGCSKELDTAELTTNPLDPDYTGPALVEKVSDRTYFSNTDEYYVFELVYRVRVDLLPISPVYSVLETDQADGSTRSVGPLNGNSGSTITRTWPNVHDGEQHCMTAQVFVQGSSTQGYTMCGTVHE